MIVVTGAGGGIGGHLVRRLVEAGETVRAVDIKPLTDWFQLHREAHNLTTDLRDAKSAEWVLRGADVLYHLAADMGGMGFIHSAECEILHNSGLININTFDAAARVGVGRLFFSSSVCVYRDMAAGEAQLTEADAWPAQPDNLYGLEKLMAEQTAMAYGRKTGMAVRIARFENTFGSHQAWTGGREKAPAAICRKVAQAGPGGRIEVWGDGTAVRSFTHVSDLVEGILALTASDLAGPTNLGSPQYVSVNDLVSTVCEVAGYAVAVEHVDGPVGVASRNFSTDRARDLGWNATTSLAEGIALTYPWVAEQVARFS